MSGMAPIFVSGIAKTVRSVAMRYFPCIEYPYKTNQINHIHLSSKDEICSNFKLHAHIFCYLPTPPPMIIPSINDTYGIFKLAIIKFTVYSTLKNFTLMSY